MNEQLYLKRVKTHDSNITEHPVALIYMVSQKKRNGNSTGCHAS
jgi:hypothetical protein